MSGSEGSRRSRRRDPSLVQDELHDRAARPLGDRAGRPLPRAVALAGRGDARRARPHRRLGAAAARDLRARRRGGARLGAGLGGALAAPCQRRRERRRARRRAGDDQGEHRDRWDAGAARHGGDRARAGAARCAAGGAPARGRRGDPRQDDDARLRDAVVGTVELPRRDPQPVGPEQEPGRQQLGRGRRRRRRLRAAPPRHRHRRLGAPAGRLVRHLHPEAEPRPRSRSTRRTPAASPGR